MLTENNITQAEKLYPADPELTAKAKDAVKTVKDKMMPTSCMPLLAMLNYVTREVYAACFPTMQVQLAADHIPVLGISPEFVCELDSLQNVMFILFHEALHLLRCHLVENDALKRADSRYVQAQEAWINYYVTSLTHLPMPTIKGEVTGVDPKNVYDWTRKAAQAQGLSGFPSISDFYLSEETAYEWLCQLEKEKRPSANFCSHKPGEGTSLDDADPNSSGSVLDPGAVGELVEKALEAALRKAVNENNKAAQEELKRLMKSAAGNERAEKIFGDLGAYELLGQTAPERKTNLWDRLVRHLVGRLIEPGTRLTLNRKRLDQRILTHKGKQNRPNVVIAVDTSGSMAYGNALEKITAMIGKTKAKVTWLWWDGQVWQFEPGDEVRGGGGTDCRVVDKWILDNMRIYPDAVICVTDGYFTHFTPASPRKWVWLLTKNGDHWPLSWTPRMNTVILPFES